jgi:hypothetical protein
MNAPRLLSYVAAFLAFAPMTLFAQQPVRVSMIDLLSTRTNTMARVSVKGFLRLEFEGNALYLHREDIEQNLTDNTVWIEPAKLQTGKIRAISDRYVIVVGKFEANKHGHMGPFGGTISSITRLDPCPSRSDVDRMTGHGSSTP